ncbi:MAG: hypothetical protein AB7I68_09190 [Porticoccaceae bacterium]
MGRQQHGGTTGTGSVGTAAGAVFHRSVAGGFRLRRGAMRRLVRAAVALAALPAVAATFPIDLHPDWGDMHIGAETGTIEGFRPIAYVTLSSQDSRRARCRVTFDMRALAPEVFHVQLAPGQKRTVRYDSIRAINRMTIDVHCSPLRDTTDAAPETDRWEP